VVVVVVVMSLLIICINTYNCLHWYIVLILVLHSIVLILVLHSLCMTTAWRDTLCWDMLVTQEDIAGGIGHELEFEVALQHCFTIHGLGMYMVRKGMKRANKQLLRHVFAKMKHMWNGLTLNCLDGRYAGMSVADIIAVRWQIRRMPL
jgi:hypothetical protein